MALDNWSDKLKELKGDIRAKRLRARNEFQNRIAAHPKTPGIVEEIIELVRERDKLRLVCGPLGHVKDVGYAALAAERVNEIERRIESYVNPHLVDTQVCEKVTGHEQCALCGGVHHDDTVCDV